MKRQGLLIKVLASFCSGDDRHFARRFHNTMSTFLRQAEEEIMKLQSQESMCLSWVKEMAEYFHGDAANDEAHMLIIFAGVREFLAMLDRISFSGMAATVEMTP